MPRPKPIRQGAHATAWCRWVQSSRPTRAGSIQTAARPTDSRSAPAKGSRAITEPLDFPECNEGPCAGFEGGAAIRCYAEYGYGCCLDEGQEFTLTEPGTKVGPFRQGMQARFDSDTDRREGICYSEYTGNGMRVMPLPVIETFDVNGKKMVRIIKFSAFFMQERPPGNGELEGQFVHDVTPGEGGGQGGGTLYVIRLIE